MPIKTGKEGVLTIFNESGELMAIVYKDMKTRKNVFYSVNEMGMEELEHLLKTETVKKEEKSE